LYHVGVKSSTRHPSVPSVASADTWHVFERAAAAAPVEETAVEMVRRAGHARRMLPSEVHDSLTDFADTSNPAGALLLRGVPVGAVPATPHSRDRLAKADTVSEFALLSVARCLGHPVGYLPEHGGALVQNLFPIAATANQQVSTSSNVDLFFHTETAFHPHRPRYLLLLCLRGEPAARTTLCSIDAVIDEFNASELAVLRQRRFRTGVDASFGASHNDSGDTIAVLSGDQLQPAFVFDADLMIGTDHESDRVLQKLGALIVEHATSVVLDAGDLLVIDNHRAVHGRSPFPARFDGTDRWLQRSFVVGDLAPSAGERNGRIITTRWDERSRVVS
jgi:L-asparagine oxygenase